MYRTVLSLFTVFLFVFPIHGQTVPPRDRLEQLEKMRREAAALFQSYQNLSGEAYTHGYDKYIDSMNTRIALALKYVDEFQFESLGQDDLSALLKIAEIAQDDRKQAHILSYLFEKHPETKNNPEYQQQFFMNAALLLPDRAEPYLSAHENTPLSEFKIVSHFMLAAGFAQSDNLVKARHYLETWNHLLQQSLADTSLQKERYLSQAAELNTFLVYRIHGKEAAHEALQKARQWANIQWFNDAMENLRKKLDVLGRPVRSLQTEHWIGADDNTDISSFRGKVVLVNFFRWSCGACNASIPQLQAIKNRFAKEDFAIVGATDYRGQYEHEKNVSKTREYELMRDHYRVQRKVDWPISMSETGMNNYGIDKTPTYLLIDRNGLVREWDANISYSYLAERIKALVEETN